MDCMGMIKKKVYKPKIHQYLPIGGGFNDFWFFTPISGEMIQFDEYFSNGLKPSTRPHLEVGNTSYALGCQPFANFLRHLSIMKTAQVIS